MNPEALKILTRQELQADASSNRFGLTPMPRHIHYGVDSPPTFEPTRVYTGFVPSNADLTGASTDGFVYFPNGWSVSVSGNVYFITHNLGTRNYAMFPTMGGPDTPAPCYVGTGILDNICQVAFVNTNIVSPAFIPQDFWFTLVQINNKDANFPSYPSSKP